VSGRVLRLTFVILETDNEANPQVLKENAQLSWHLGFWHGCLRNLGPRISCGALKNQPQGNGKSQAEETSHRVHAH